MAGEVGGWSRVIRAVDAASLAHVLGLAVLIATERASAFEALGIVFAGPLYVAGVVCVARWMGVALTGRLPRSMEERPRPRAHLGRPSWETATRIPSTRDPAAAERYGTR